MAGPLFVGGAWGLVRGVGCVELGCERKLKGVLSAVGENELGAPQGVLQ